MMNSDGGLRALFRTHLPRAQWTTVETGMTARGVPDAEYCFPDGVQGWVEFKWTRAWAVKVRPGQVGWLDRRTRLGARATVAVRRINRGSDELWMVPAHSVKRLKDRGLRDWSGPRVTTAGGPARWDWEEVEAFLMRSVNGRNI